MSGRPSRRSRASADLGLLPVDDGESGTARSGAPLRAWSEASSGGDRDRGVGGDRGVGVGAATAPLVRPGGGRSRPVRPRPALPASGRPYSRAGVPLQTGGSLSARTRRAPAVDTYPSRRSGPGEARASVTLTRPPVARERPDRRPDQESLIPDGLVGDGLVGAGPDGTDLVGAGLDGARPDEDGAGQRGGGAAAASGHVAAGRPDRARTGEELPSDLEPTDGRRDLRITPIAWGLLVALAGCAAGAAGLRYPELAVFAGAAAAALLTGVLAVARPPRVSVALRVEPGAVARGDEARLVFSVVNHSRRTAPTFALRLPFGPLPTPDAPPSEASLDVRQLRGSARRDLVLPLDTGTRGVLRLGPAQIHRRDPFGLAERRRRLGRGVLLRVRPRVHPLAGLPAAPARDPDGQTGSGTAGGLMFHTLREYTAGEELRLVHWPSSARLGTLMVRTHVDPGEPTSTIVLDTRLGAYPPGPVGAEVFEDAVDAAASAVLASARSSHGVRLLTSNGLRVHGRRRRGDVESLLDELAAVRPDQGETLDVLRTLRRGPAGTLILVTGGFDRDALAAVAPVAHVFGQVIVLRMGPRSEAAAQARARRTTSDRPRLRASAAAAGQVDVTGSRRVRVIHVPTAADLPGYWPVAAGPDTWRPVPGLAHHQVGGP